MHKRFLGGVADDVVLDKRSDEDFHQAVYGRSCKDQADLVLGGKIHPLHLEVDASSWCITSKDLEHFEKEVKKAWKEGRIPDNPDFPNPDHDDENYGPTVHQVNKHFIKPRTLAAGGMSWALMRNRKGLKCDVFATHCWSEGIFEFISKVLKNWPEKGQHLYCCFLANPQNGSIADLLSSDDPRESPFGKALATAKFFVVIPNHSVSIYSRLWCVYEAHLAVQACADRGLQIILPQQTSYTKLFMFAGPGALFFVIAEIVTTFTLAPAYGKYFAPMEWLMFSQVLSAIIGRLSPCIARRCLCQLYGSRAKRNSSWVQLCFLGAGLGLARWHLAQADMLGNMDGEGSRSNNIGSRTIQWEPGEGWALVPLALCLTAAYIWNIMVALNQKVLRHESAALDFTTIRDAECSVKSDEDKIKNAIIGCEDEIDKTIEVLLTVGRYDNAVAYNIEAGMTPQKARRGVNPFYIWCACIEWTYWWITDLSAAKHHVFAMQVMVAPIVCMTACVYCFAVSADRFIFAVDACFWSGLFFVLVSIWRESMLPGYDYQEHNQMSWGTLGLQISSFAIAVIVILYQYSGYRRYVSNSRSRQVSRIEGYVEDPDRSRAFSPRVSPEPLLESSESDVETSREHGHEGCATVDVCISSARGIQAEFDDQEDTTDSNESSDPEEPLLSDLEQSPAPRQTARLADTGWSHRV